MNVLAELVSDRRARIAREMRRDSSPPARGSERASDGWSRRMLEAPRVGRRVIAEIKRRSPSRGELDRGLDPVALARVYERAGATAISVLTEPDHFGGSFADLEAVARAVAVPVLCKDVVVDPCQVHLARRAGASLILLMVCVLGDATAEYVIRVRESGMEPLVEVHDEAEVEVALSAGARIVGINNRDLRSLEVDLGVSRRLLPMLSERAVAVVESGLSRPVELAELAAQGAAAFLVGEALVTAPEPGAVLRHLIGG